MLICIKQPPSLFKAHFIKKWSDTKTEQTKCVAYKKGCVITFFRVTFFICSLPYGS